jgi:hypothetical protein
VQSEQRILHHILGFLLGGAAPPRQRAGERQYALEEGAIGGGVAPLGRRQQPRMILSVAGLCQDALRSLL